MTPSPILVSIDSNEAMRPRGERIRKAIEKDDSFQLLGNSKELSFDLQFRRILEEIPDEELCSGMHLPRIENPMNIEIKDFSEDGNSDYLASILNGHLWEQCMAARELGVPFVIVVLGDDNDVCAAIRKAASHVCGGKRVDPNKLMEYYRMVEGFEANCLGLGILVWRLKTDPYKRMLLRVRKILEGGDLRGFVPSPADGERAVVGLSILAGRGVGPKKAANILKRFNICLKPKDGCSAVLEDCEGIGPKLAERIRENIEVKE